MYAEVAVNVAVQQNTFTYEIPPALHKKIQIGYLVRVPFRTAQHPGIVVEIHERDVEYITKPIIELLNSEPIVTQKQIDLAIWMSETYLSPLGSCLWLTLPPGFSGKYEKRIHLLQPDFQTDHPTQNAILEELRQSNELNTRQLDRRIDENIQKALDALEEAGVIEIEVRLSRPTVNAKMGKTYALALPPEEIPNRILDLGRASKPAEILQLLAHSNEPVSQKHILSLPGIGKRSLETLIEENLVEVVEQHGEKYVHLMIETGEVLSAIVHLKNAHKHLAILHFVAHENTFVPPERIYEKTNTKRKHINHLVQNGFLLEKEQRIWRDTLENREFIPATAPKLTQEQQNACDAIIQSIDNMNHVDAPINGKDTTFLLHGVTGSGKTEIYLQIIEYMLQLGRQAIFLVPEIALTPQTVNRVMARFPDIVGVVHSGIETPGARYDTWERARNGELKIIVGARSALFSPLPDVGVVILDEEHDQSYKQSPTFHHPYYHARSVAEEMMHRNRGIVILGSATPDIETYYRAFEKKSIYYLHLPNRIMGHRTRITEQSARQGVATRYQPMLEDALTIDLPAVTVVDMREELKSGNTSMFSYELQQALKQVLHRGEQAILYLNRRGQSTYIFCRDCGYVLQCPNCDTPMTYHRKGDAVRCHHCNHSTFAPQVCPECNSRRIKYFGAGTQAIEKELEKYFDKDQFQSIRWDADEVKKVSDHETILQDFLNGEANIIIGTQMVAKGLDLPMVTLVGIVSADLGLALPDFRAGERTFQLLTQVAGRAGRGILGGRVILQTYKPDHYAVDMASRHSYEGFYQREIEYRRLMGYPPFRHLIRILFRDEKEIRARMQAENAVIELNRVIEELDLQGTIEIIGPAPCFFTRLERYYRWHILLRGANPLEVFDHIDVPNEWYVDIDPVEIL